MKKWVSMVKKLWVCLDKKIQNDRRCRILLVLGLMLAVFIIYFVYGLQFSRPFVIDEIGYLNKALALTGLKLDAASSWQAGYSFIILPVFWIFHDPNMQWKAVLFINTVMWSLNSGLLFYVLRRYFPKKTNLTIAPFVFLTMLFPGFIGISGYAYVNSAFVLVLMLAFACFIKSNFKFNIYLVSFSFFAGYLTWIHPTAIVLIVVLLLFFVYKLFYKSKFIENIFPVLILTIMPLIYYLVVHPWLNNIMTPSGLTIINHYGDFAKNFPIRAKSFSFWLQVIGLFVGQIYYLLIASFGLILAGIDYLSLKKKKIIEVFNDQILCDPKRAFLAVLFVTVIGVALMEALYFPADVLPLRADQWIFGRYTEMYVLPLIGIGLIYGINKVTRMWAIGFIAISAVIISLITNVSNAGFKYIATEDVQSFWPITLFCDTNFLLWAITGILGIIFVGYFISRNNKMPLLLIIPIMFFTIYNQSMNHIYGISYNNSDIELINLINDSYPKNTCVGLDDSMNFEQNGRFNYYSFYLQSYKVSRMKFGEWYKNCSGPYLTFDSKLNKKVSGVRFVARNSRSGICIFVRDNDKELKSLPASSAEIDYGALKQKGCEVEGCMDWEASSKDLTITQVGSYQDGTLSSTSKEGYLLVSKKTFVYAGVYRLKLNLDIQKFDEASSIRITSHNGAMNHLINYFDNYPNNRDFIFQLGENVDDLQVIIYVGRDAKMSLRSYNNEVVYGG
jgi:hypothetical protein